MIFFPSRKWQLPQKLRQARGHSCPTWTWCPQKLSIFTALPHQITGAGKTDDFQTHQLMKSSPQEPSKQHRIVALLTVGSSVHCTAVRAQCRDRRAGHRVHRIQYILHSTDSLCLSSYILLSKNLLFFQNLHLSDPYRKEEKVCSQNYICRDLGCSHGQMLLAWCSSKPSRGCKTCPKVPATPAALLASLKIVAQV